MATPSIKAAVKRLERKANAKHVGFEPPIEEIIRTAIPFTATDDFIPPDGPERATSQEAQRGLSAWLSDLGIEAPACPCHTPGARANEDGALTMDFECYADKEDADRLAPLPADKTCVLPDGRALTVRYGYYWQRR